MVKLHSKRVEKMYHRTSMYTPNSINVNSIRATKMGHLNTEWEPALHARRNRATGKVKNTLVSSVVFKKIGVKSTRIKDNTVMTVLADIFLKKKLFSFSTRFECNFPCFHSFRVWFYIFPNRFECSFTSSSLVSSVVLHLLHSFCNMIKMT